MLTPATHPEPVFSDAAHIALLAAPLALATFAVLRTAIRGGARG